MTTTIFTHDGKTFEVRRTVIDSRYCVKVFLNGMQVSPEYSATVEVGHDYFAQHQESLLTELADIAEADICRGIYFNA